MTRRLFNLLTLLSLLLCVLTAAMGVRSRRVTEVWAFEDRPVAVDPSNNVWGITAWSLCRWVRSSEGRLMLVARELPNTSERDWPGYHRYADPWGYSRPLEAGAPGERRWVVPGIEFLRVPHTVHRQPAAGGGGTADERSGPLAGAAVRRGVVVGARRCRLGVAGLASLAVAGEMARSKALPPRRPLPALRLRPARHAGAVPGMRLVRPGHHSDMKRRLLNLLLCVAAAVPWVGIPRGVSP